MASLKNTIITGTLQLPAGTTGQRPGTPVKGMLRYNTTYGVNEIYNGSIWWDLTHYCPADIGLGPTTPAISGTQLLHARPSYASGNYYIQPPGQSAYLVYVDMTNQGGGWVLVGCGMQGASNGVAWWDDNGGGTYSTQLVAANLGSATVNYMPRDWIRALVRGSTWNSMGGMICNRTQLGDSFYFRTASNTFNWSDFLNSPASYSLTYGRYTGQWLSSTNSYNYTNTSWTDTLNNGAPVANDQTRLFTWNWSGHSAGGVQYSGWSAGSTVSSPGFTAGGEGHAIQQVNVFVK